MQDSGCADGGDGVPGWHGFCGRLLQVSQLPHSKEGEGEQLLQGRI